VGGFDSRAFALEGACDPFRVPSFASKMALEAQVRACARALEDIRFLAATATLRAVS
jgi:hypothetical protein